MSWYVFIEIIPTLRLRTTVSRYLIIPSMCLEVLHNLAAAHKSRPTGAKTMSLHNHIVR